MTIEADLEELGDRHGAMNERFRSEPLALRKLNWPVPTDERYAGPER